MSAENNDQTQGKLFHMTVVNGMSVPQVLDDRQSDNPIPNFAAYTVRQVKAALLYADHITISSFGISLMLDSLTPLFRTSDVDIHKRISVLASKHSKKRDPTCSLCNILTMYDELESINKRSRKLVPRRKELQSDIEAGLDEWAKEIANENLYKYFSELEPAFKAGLLDINIPKPSKSKEDSYFGLRTNSRNKLVKLQISVFDRVLNRVMYSLLHSNTFPVFDDQAGSIIHAFIQHYIEHHQGRISSTASDKEKHGLLALQLLERLPLFSEAKIDEILDIRKELESPLIHFRKTIIDLSEQIKSEPWSEDFSYDVEKIFHKDVAPSVAEIEEATKTNKSLLSILNRALAKPLASGGILALALSQISALPNLASYTLAGSGVAAAIGTGVSIMHDIAEEQRKLEQNQFYFYYRLKALSK